MRLLLAAVTSALSIAALTGCGDDVGTGTVTPATATSPGTSSTLQAYDLLAGEVTRFVAAADAAEQSSPDVDPQTPEELLALIDYTFADGVTLSVYEDKHNGHVCFTGPEETFLSLSESESGDLRQILGTGECAYDDGDVVLELVLKPGARVHVEPRVIKGKDIAEQIPALDGFVDQLNEALAGSGVPEGDVTASGADQ